jgi:tripartite-type tricarboxylate transporter receptor subunit TctC
VDLSNDFSMDVADAKINGDSEWSRGGNFFFACTKRGGSLSRRRKNAGGVMVIRSSRLFLIAAVSLFVHTVIPTIVVAQSWPTRPVRLILPFGPGSGADTAARLLADKLQVTWGQSIIVEGKPGGGGVISVGSVVSANDDHILFFGPTSAYVVQPYEHEGMSYDPEKAIPTSLGISTVKELVTLARENPSKVSYAVAPGFSEFVLDGFMRESGLHIAKVPYRDITTSPIDLVENRIQLSMQSYAAMRSYEQTGKIKIIAINDHQRSAAAPDIPSVDEAGFPSLVASPVLGLLGPRDMPLPLRQKIAADVLEALQDKVIGERLAFTGQPTSPMGVEAFSAAVADQYAQVARIAGILGIERKK